MAILKQIFSYLFSLIGLKNTNWKIEKIPDDSLLYRRIHFQYVINDIQDENRPKPNPSCFKDFELSCDWNKYSNPKKSLDLIGKEYKTIPKNGVFDFKNPNDFFIVSFLVKIVTEKTFNQEILHNPIQNVPEKLGIPNNRSHSLIRGEKSGNEDKHVKTRFWLYKISKWEIFDELKLKELQGRNKK